MDYEETYEQQPFNYRLLLLLCLCSVFFGIMIYPMIKVKPEPIKPIEQNKSDAIQIVYRDVMIQPTIDGKMYFASEYQNGLRKINRPFSFRRDNTIGKMNTVVHSIVYDYKIFNSYKWFNPSDYKYYTEKPLSDDNKFLFVFYNIYLDDIEGDDTRFWITTEGQMKLIINGIAFTPVNFPKQIRIKELENTYNLNDDNRVTAYNSMRVYNPSTQYSKTAGETFETFDVLKGGKSNAIDGYILFEVPKSTRDEDLIFAVNYYSWGDAQWKLKTI